jgi:hypothetical protein
MAYIYEPIACHSYNEVTIDGKQIKIATIDTILAFYLSFLYANMPHYDKDRLLCIAMFLFQMEQHNRLDQSGILKRYSIECYGKQSTLEDIRSKKTEMFKELGKDRESKEYQMWFLKYTPGDTSKTEKRKTKTTTNKTRKNKQKISKEHPILALIQNK